MGVLSILMLLFAILSLVLPIVSVATGLSISSPQTSQGSLPKSLTITNHGFLAVSGVYVSVDLVSSNGTTISTVTLGPANIPPGSTVPLNIVESVNGLPNGTSYRVDATARANLGGIIPISVSADFTGTNTNSTGSGQPG